MKNRLKELRRRYQWSQADLARKLEVSRQAVNGFESGQFDPSLAMACKISSLLNVAIEDIFIYEAENSMQAFAQQIKDFLGLKFGFERFTEQAIHAINFSRYEAMRSGNTLVEPEHLLKGLLANPTATSARLLRENGVRLSLKTDRYSLEGCENLKLSAANHFVLELALQVVRLQGKKAIETEHLLWGLLRLAETKDGVLDRLLSQDECDRVNLNRQLTETI